MAKTTAAPPPATDRPLAKAKQHYEYQPLMRVGGADGLQGLANAMKGRLAAVLPRHITPDRMLKALMVAASKTPALFECTQESICKAIMDASSLGLDCSGTLGSGYLVPFNKSMKDAQGRWQSRKECQFIPGYRGLIDLARRGGQIADIQVHAVYNQDTFTIEYGTSPEIKHTPYTGADRANEIIGVYAVAFFKDGGKHPEFMTIADINVIRDETMRKNRQKEPSGPWADHYIEMAKKTVIRRLCKTLPLSPEVERAFALDDEARAAMENQTITVESISTGSKSAEIADRLAPGSDGASAPPAEVEQDPATTAPEATQAALDAAKAKLGAGTPTDPDGLPADWATDERNAPPGSAPVEAEEA